MKGFDEWLTPERLKAEDYAWLAEHGENREKVAADLHRLIEVEGLNHGSVLELGCGAGWITDRLPHGFTYLGVDAYPGCVELAKSRCTNPDAEFMLDEWHDACQLSSCRFTILFSTEVLKHFPLSAIYDRLAEALGIADYSLFTVGIGDCEHEDGVDYYHTWVTEEKVLDTIARAEHEVVFTRKTGDAYDSFRNVLYATRRMPVLAEGI